MEYITVCEDKIKPQDDQIIPAVVYKGQTYYFCEKKCLDNFILNPDRFLIEHKPNFKPIIIE